MGACTQRAMARAQHGAAEARPTNPHRGAKRPRTVRTTRRGRLRRVRMAIGVGLGTFVLLIMLLMVLSFRVLREYERAVVFMLGRFWKVKGPGFFLLIPAVQQMVRIDLRTVVMDVP